MLMQIWLKQTAASRVSRAIGGLDIAEIQSVAVRETAKTEAGKFVS